MKLNKLYLIFAISLAALAGCSEDEENKSRFDNKVFIDSAERKTTFIKKPSLLEGQRTIVAATAKPAHKDLEIRYTVDKALVGYYNEFYYDDAEMLPEKFYEIPETTDVILEGRVKSSGIDVIFKKLDELEKDVNYVLPVSIGSADGMPMLESAKAMYYVFRDGSIINIAGDLEKNYCTINWADKAPLNGLKQLTMEALVKANYFSRFGSESNILTVMGIEEYFLIRCGDTNYPGQIQIAMGGASKFPGKDADKVLALGEWSHIAVTYDGDTRVLKVYVNGVLQTETEPLAGKHSAVNLGSDDFLIGGSAGDNRWWPGEIAECRIWNVVRTQEEIADNPYEVAPNSEGLVAYWKFDEGRGKVVKDHSVYGNHAEGVNSIKWVPVALPAPVN